MAQRQSQWPSAQKAVRASLSELFNEHKDGEEMPLAGDALAYSFSKCPRMTRLAGGIFTVVAISDVLHDVFSAVQKIEK